MLMVRNRQEHLYLPGIHICSFLDQPHAEEGMMTKLLPFCHFSVVANSLCTVELPLTCIQKLCHSQCHKQPVQSKGHAHAVDLVGN